MRQPDAGRRSWELLRRDWGAAVADALWHERPVEVTSGGMRFQVTYDAQYSSVKVKNLTTGFKLCVSIERAWEYPAGDKLLGILEHIRLNPSHVESIAGHSVDWDGVAPRECFNTGWRAGFSVVPILRDLGERLSSFTHWLSENTGDIAGVLERLSPR